MPPDDPLSLPNPPPPRPDKREAAIATALRKFDGEPEPARPIRPAATGGWWARSRQPQFAMGMSLALIAGIGVPATWIAIQNGALNPPNEPSSPAASRSAAPPAMRDTTDVQAATAAPPEPAQPNARELSVSGAAERNPTPPPVVANEADAKADEAPAAQLVAAPPPPPPAPPPPPPPPPAPAPAPPMAAQKSAEGLASGDIVTTGSRIPRPRVSAEQDQADALNSLPMREAAPAAPGWVMQDRAYRTFLTQLQSAVRANDRGAVVRLVGLPLRVNSNGTSQVYRDAASVKRDYERIFTPSVRQAILNQRFERLFGRDQGVMIGDGQVWFDHRCTNASCSPPGPVRITAINR